MSNMKEFAELDLLGELISCDGTQSEMSSAFLHSELTALGWHHRSVDEAVARFLLGNLTQAPSRVPGPDLTRPPSHLTAGEAKYPILMFSRVPRAMLIGSFLHEAECQQIIDLSVPRMRRSLVVSPTDDVNSDGSISYGRTSSQTYFGFGDAEICDTVFRRASEALNWPIEQMEGLQVLRYGKGAEFTPHFDFFDPRSHSDIIERTGQRVGSLLMYLNTPVAGGGTIFPDANFEVAPHMGNAFLFTYDHPDADTLTLHGGSPVGAGEKWLATIFITDRARMPKTGARGE